MDKSCLVLQGGGMRTMYTSGVLDAFMENDILINNVYAVSAGCYNALSYLSRQKGRSYKINSTYLRDKRYISMTRLFTKGSAVNTDFIFDEVFKNLEPFDYETFKKNSENFYAVSTDCINGNAIYAKISDLNSDCEYVKASAALPLFTKLVEVDDFILTDGGISDSIPIRKAIDDGFTKNIVILTQPKEYVFKNGNLLKFYKIKYKKYPNLLKKMEDRPSMYNETMAFINKLEEENKIIVIRPENHLNIANLEKDKNKIKKIYDIGYNDGLKYIDKIKEFLKGNEQNEK